MSQILQKNPALLRFNKQEVTEKHLLQAVHYGKFKFDKEEAERKKREAIEAEKNKEE
jgi:tellurite resistance protein